MKGSLATENKIIEMLSDGVRQSEICKKLGVGHQRVKRIAKVYGIIPNGKRSNAIAKNNDDEQVREIKVAPATGGFDLKGKPLMAKKPTNIWKPRFNSLRKETGYLPEVLAEQWGCSTTTLRARARALRALRYTELDGQYVEIVVNPQTRDGK